MLEVQQGETAEFGTGRGDSMKAFLSVFLLVLIVCALTVGVLVEAQPWSKRDVRQWKLSEAVKEMKGGK